MAYVQYFQFIITLSFCIIINWVLAEKFGCKFGLCNEEQHCCGRNKCCENPLDLWYLWLGMVIICFVSTIIIIIRCLVRKPPKENRYNRLSTDEC